MSLGKSLDAAAYFWQIETNFVNLNIDFSTMPSLSPDKLLAADLQNIVKSSDANHKFLISTGERVNHRSSTVTCDFCPRSSDKWAKHKEAPANICVFNLQP